MSKITKIAKIDNFGIFQNFDWNTHLSSNPAQQNQTYDFKDINIFYGRNYSGKTSLSKIIRALETKTLSPKYENPNFRIELADSSIISQNNLSAFAHPIHVYNSDFIRENLKFIHDENANIESFSVTLGGDNQQIVNRIQELKDELGSNEENTKSGVFLDIQNKENDVKNAKENYSNKNRDLEKLLTDKATRNSDSIKNQHLLFGDINYTIAKLKQDIVLAQDTTFQVLTDDQITEKKALINQIELADPSTILTYNLDFLPSVTSTNKIIEIIVGGDQKIPELVSNDDLNIWVQSGHTLHKDRTTCAFCSNTISEKRREELGQHFDQETEKLQQRISAGIKHLDTLLESQDLKINFNIDEYYQHYHNNLSELRTALKTSLKKQESSIKQLKTLLEQKNKKLFTKLEAIYPTDYSEEINTILRKISDIRNTCIKLNSELTTQQKEAKTALRINHIYHFLQDINYTQQNTDISLAFEAIAPLEIELTTLQTRKTTITTEIKSEEDKLKSEGEACKRINDILQHDFGHQAISLKAIENTHAQNIHFEIQRNGIKAHNLSEGEQSLISFCYFLAKIQDDLNQNKKPIIWIDDPISSLDSNHIFFIYALINNLICKLKQFSQLFISTHNLEFLKYLKRLDISFNNNGATPNLKVSKYLIQRMSDNSYIHKMPIYMSEYATEFNYLFKQIHTCATEILVTDQNHSCFYNFGNNARKFIEIYSFYKFPTHMSDDERLKLFWNNEELERLFIGRINNELSHCSGVFERGMSLIDEPEMQRAAKAIIEKVQIDINQYNALLESVNIDIQDDSLHPNNQTP
ncbi:AAA family ATPase [Acinetobacter dispersus]|uniref:AAA family ATPase n=1 Tax=Acinetobacter dispersus TaxID=70348 RepID=UPI001F4B36D3|nr:AAA family ATPase [Acinetobacter dispersus]MCH7392107.1 AAA family ATPase [Acinetobacter dispersus]